MKAKVTISSCVVGIRRASRVHNCTQSHKICSTATILRNMSLLLRSSISSSVMEGSLSIISRRRASRSCFASRDHRLPQSALRFVSHIDGGIESRALAIASSSKHSSRVAMAARATVMLVASSFQIVSLGHRDVHMSWGQAILSLQSLHKVL